MDLSVVDDDDNQDLTYEPEMPSTRDSIIEQNLIPLHSSNEIQNDHFNEPFFEYNGSAPQTPNIRINKDSTQLLSENETIMQKLSSADPNQAHHLMKTFQDNIQQILQQTELISGNEVQRMTPVPNKIISFEK